MESPICRLSVSSMCLVPIHRFWFFRQQDASEITPQNIHLENCEATKEVVINVVNYDIVQQVSLSSTEYPDGVNEFLKSGLTMLPSDMVKPYRVAESPVQMECKVNEIIALGNQGGAGNLIICEVD